ncbi:SH3 domain-containing protein [Arthrobacter sp. ISL-5]|uniref:SH3 domain-containing protein n=1 Tax=Arthrobacter sp. ISL-5 TaxID=2819111 RepID=UPI001BE96C88|nr:SH3 domain-containing protein [Arthrobacter sp. ISL-5]MBT2555499.1 SH3 domain-containing protein [Arthrobacter sp. ISL-5]
MNDSRGPAHARAQRRPLPSGVGSPTKQADQPAAFNGAVSPTAPATKATVLRLQSIVGNTATRRLVSQAPSTGERAVQRAPGSPAPAASVTLPSPPVPSAPPSAGNRVAFVREEGLNLRAGPDQASNSLAQLPFGARVHVLEDEAIHPGWQKVTTPAAAVGFLSAHRVHFAPTDLVARDPGMSMIRIRSGQTFWGLVKEQYGIQGNESTADQNINHFINAIRSVNKGDAFIVNTDWLDDIGNWVIGGRDASDTSLKAGYDLWIPSFGVAVAMDVGSGTVTGEVARIVKKIEQKIQDFGTACSATVKYVPGAVSRHAGETAMGLLTGLIDFAIDAAKILAVSTAVGALIGALFGGVGAVPGAEIGFEIGLLILEYYGLAMLIEAILSMAGSLVGQLGSFVSQVWNANGDAKQLDTAGKTLADALGILVSALLVALAAYLMKKGGDALAKTKFAGKVGQSQLARWLTDRQKMKTTAETISPPASMLPPRESGAIDRESGKAGSTRNKASAGAKTGSDPTPETIRAGTVRMDEHPNYGTEVAALQERGFTIVRTTGDPHVVIRRVVGSDGSVLRVEKEVHVRTDMRHLDFEHEVGHVRQVTDPARFPDGPPPTEIRIEDSRGMRKAPNQGGVLNTRQNAIMEYHNRLQELVWLEKRGTSSSVMREHLEGIDGSISDKGWRRRYLDATRGGEKSSITQWAKERFPDIPEFEGRVADIRRKLLNEK